ncbi:AAA family ATPase [bacterium]|nr:AAA family ATPase [bacterium]
MIKLKDLLYENTAGDVEAKIRKVFLMEPGSFNTGWKMSKRQYKGLIKSLKRQFGSIVDKVVKELEKYKYIEPQGSMVIWNDGIKSSGTIITEGVYDPGIFKAVFLSGAPGSGKSYVASQLFGIPEKVNISAYGLKMVNQDTELEMFLKKYFGTVDIDNMPDELFLQLTNPKSTKKGAGAYSGMRTHTKALSKQRLKNYTDGRLGAIIDGTGHKYKDVKSERKKLIDLGYDTFMVFVNTSLEIAQKRNEDRPRRLPANVVEKYWHSVQKNMAFFQGLFGNANFLLVDNNKHLNSKQAQSKFNMLVGKGIGKFLKKPIKNKQANKWIEKQKLLKKR